MSQQSELVDGAPLLRAHELDSDKSARTRDPLRGCRRSRQIPRARHRNRQVAVGESLPFARRRRRKQLPLDPMSGKLVLIPIRHRKRALRRVTARYEEQHDGHGCGMRHRITCPSTPRYPAFVNQGGTEYPQFKVAHRAHDRLLGIRRAQRGRRLVVRGPAANLVRRVLDADLEGSKWRSRRSGRAARRTRRPERAGRRARGYRGGRHPSARQGRQSAGAEEPRSRARFRACAKAPLRLRASADSAVPSSPLPPPTLYLSSHFFQSRLFGGSLGAYFDASPVARTSAIWRNASDSLGFTPP